MPVGQYEFNFNFPLPIDKKLPSSAELMWYDSRIRYCIIATLNDKKKKLYRTVKVFTFLEIIDVNRPQFKAPPPLIEVENTSCCLCYQSLPTLLTISTDRSAYCPGESIKFEVVCDNMTSSRIKYIAAKLARTTDLHVGERTFPHVRHYYSEVRSTEEISGGQSFTWHEASMKIPSLPPSIKSNFITVSYELLIIAKFVHSPNQLASAPITIGSIPLNLQPDPSPPASDVNRLQFANVVFEGCVDDCGRNINSKNKFKPFYPVARI
ncbi:Arrestin domain-containing protein 3 [Trichoplax sp. H2]|nr:Arrestin domain-containing protein 3 [Trichoplax sp. H2]|eukprot:RDD41416.1 Arrestin domain-containing protein 3 [Trichoplax sp. H2]